MTTARSPRRARGSSAQRPRASPASSIADLLLSSPLPRAKATADIAARAFRRIEAKVEPALAGESVEGIVAALREVASTPTVAIVGHEPVLSALLAHLLEASQPERLSFKKGGAALVDLPDGPGVPGRLDWFLKPRILRTLRATRFGF